MKYELTTLKDVFDKVPADRIKTCLHELASAMEHTKAMTKLFCQSAEEITGVTDCVVVQWPETSTWIDDDKGMLTLRFSTDDGSEDLEYTAPLRSTP